MNLTSTEEDEGLRPMDNEDNVQMIKKKGTGKVGNNHELHGGNKIKTGDSPSPSTC